MPCAHSRVSFVFVRMNTPIVQVMCDLEQCEQLIATHEAQVGPTFVEG